MDISVVASTSLGHQASKEELDKLGGLGAGVCYLPDTMEKLFAGYINTKLYSYLKILQE